MSDQQNETPAGWYPDPQGGGGQRYWDGQQWTEHTAPPPEAAPPPPGTAAATGAGPGAATGPGGAQMAGVGIRFGARLLDGLIVGIPLAVVLGALGIGVYSGDAGGQFIAGIVSAVVGVAYFMLMESSSGQTLGKRILNLRTVASDGSTPTQEQAFKRNAWMLLGIIPFLGGLAQLAIAIWIAVEISNKGYGPHDEWGDGTRVLRT